MREEAIKKVMSQHGLPHHLAELVVDHDGTVNQGKLSVALSGVSWGQQPASHASPELIQALKDALAGAMAKRDMNAVMCLRSRLAKMGVPNPE
jgi:hypothetical protein